MADRRRKDAICTYTGRAIRPLDPSYKDISIEDIAGSLSKLCRFNGHCSEFYSVAQHSVYVSQLCPTFPLEGLLHDASEYVLGDIAKPVKKAASDFGEVYEALEDLMMSSVSKRFNLDYEKAYKEVKRADDIMLVSEAESIMPPEFREFGMGTKSFNVDTIIKINPWNHKKAEKRFLKRYKELA